MSRKTWWFKRAVSQSRFALNILPRSLSTLLLLLLLTTLHTLHLPPPLQPCRIPPISSSFQSFHPSQISTISCSHWMSTSDLIYLDSLAFPSSSLMFVSLVSVPPSLSTFTRIFISKLQVTALITFCPSLLQFSSHLRIRCSNFS